MGAYSSVESHRSMTFDGVRNAAYKQAICDAVTPNSVVLDLGAGLGMLGLIAAQAGARKVYLVEPESIIEVARKVARANGLLNVECIQARSETLELPEKADILISVFTGNFLLTEDLLPSLFFARDHFMAPGGVMIPDRARMMVAPVSAPAYYQENVSNWSLAQGSAHEVESFGLDYQEARGYAANTLYYDSAKNFKAELLAAPASLLDMDLRTAEKSGCDSAAELSVSADGECHGWLGWFDMRLGRQWLSTAPDAETTHWRQVFMPLNKPVSVAAGQSLGFELKRQEYGEWIWTTTANGERQRQSTFLSEPLSPEILHKKSDAFQPELNAKGKAMSFVLSRFDGNSSTESLAEAVLEHFSDVFTSKEDALRFVKGLVRKFA
jgi:predicted RNA methylase